MNRKVGMFVVFLVLFSFAISGCHYSSAKKEIANAQTSYSDLKSKGGEKVVPYEYCSAEKFLEDAQIEFNSNDFIAAEGFAKRSTSASQAGLAAIQKTK